VRRSLEEMAHLNRVGAMGELTASLAHELNQLLARFSVMRKLPPGFSTVSLQTSRKSMNA
jgi:hypothetical protein